MMPSVTSHVPRPRMPLGSAIILDPTDRKPNSCSRSPKTRRDSTTHCRDDGISDSCAVYRLRPSRTSKSQRSNKNHSSPQQRRIGCRRFNRKEHQIRPLMRRKATKLEPLPIRSSVRTRASGPEAWANSADRDRLQPLNASNVRPRGEGRTREVGRQPKNKQRARTMLESSQLAQGVRKRRPSSVTMTSRLGFARKCWKEFNIALSISVYINEAHTRSRGASSLSFPYIGLQSSTLRRHGPSSIAAR
ncbi:phytanoyl-CoA dioxygenase [Histoplasma capsulatum H143]|uniref:Phytanoyl-CoA dioxygenase n=1 Tax=Ajellomyces capsulatus (strain H143) TaxID=544712 RepID=C6HPK9_AJECH|nr:phytanoyl-CoA dioxygenase [Histoplasma capsulatum H143]